MLSFFSQTIRIARSAFLVLLIVFGTPAVVDAEAVVIHSFESTPGRDGGNPYGPPIMVDGMLYGFTSSGGDNDCGVVYRVHPTTGEHDVVYTFGCTTGAFPMGSPVVIDSVLYGVTNEGGVGEYGVIFSVHTDGTNYTVLHDFDSSTDGASTTANLLLNDGVLYGVAQYGGSNNQGTLFSINPDGTGFTVLHEFNELLGGAHPKGGLMKEGAMLYGLTSSGGSGGQGTLFSINPDGTGFTVLHEFDTEQGTSPAGPLVAFEGLLYGLAPSGGVGNASVAFSIAPDGTGFTAHSFGDSAIDGSLAKGSFVVSGDLLYATTYQGGTNNAGTIISFNPDTFEIINLHNFTLLEGSQAESGPIVVDGVLYGTLYTSGGYDSGALYRMNVDGTGFDILHAFDESDYIPEGGESIAKLVHINGVLYGVTSDGGSGKAGVVFSVKTDGTNFTILHHFTSATDGAGPYAGLLLSGGRFYGTTGEGGGDGVGTIFSIGIDGSTFTTLHSFTNATDGGVPFGELIVSNGVLYGLTSQGGSGGVGTVFSINTDGTNFTVLHAFEEVTDGGYGEAALTLIGSTLYGVNKESGENDSGGIFSLQTDGTGFEILRYFNANEKSRGQLALIGSTLYGVSEVGGANDYGFIYSFDTSSETYVIVRDFEAGDGTPRGRLLVVDGVLYGVTVDGGADDAGIVFSINPDGTAFTLLHSLQLDIEGTESDGGLIAVGSKLYGTTSVGGAAGDGYGTVFAVVVPGLQGEQESSQEENNSRGSSRRRARTETLTPSAPSIPKALFARNLTLGSSGSDVRALQQFLNTRGYLVAVIGPGSPGYETDRFGRATKAALARFQIANGIVPAQGYFGPTTRALIERVYSLEVLTAPAQNVVAVRNLVIGMSGDDVRLLQQMLLTNGFPIPAGVTGFFGAQTRAALAVYQKKNGIIPSNGYFGPITRARMKSEGFFGVWW